MSMPEKCSCEIARAEVCEQLGIRFASIDEVLLRCMERQRTMRQMARFCIDLAKAAEDAEMRLKLAQGSCEMYGHLRAADLLAC